MENVQIITTGDNLKLISQDESIELFKNHALNFSGFRHSNFNLIVNGENIIIKDKHTGFELMLKESFNLKYRIINYINSLLK